LWQRWENDAASPRSSGSANREAIVTLPVNFHDAFSLGRSGSMASIRDEALGAL
jgi:hypothetical protein